jgi:tetratricopeptide (TPR) repeat protein
VDQATFQKIRQTLDQGRLVEAEAMLETVLARSATDELALRGIAGVRAALGKVDLAIDALRRIARRSAKPLDALDELSRFCLQHGRVEPVLAAWDRFFKLHDNSAAGHFNFAWYIGRFGRVNLALAHYERALALGIERPEEVHLNMARLYSDMLRQDEQAKRQLDRALELNANYIPAMLNLGNLAEQSGDVVTAREWFTRALQMDSKHPTALARLADTMSFTPSAADANEAAALLPSLRELATTSDDADLAFSLGRAEEQRGDYAAAWTHYQRGNEQDRATLSPYRAEAIEQGISRLIATCTPEWVSARQTQQAATPVFICGMFRSGSTLLEQMLAAHPAFKPAGEREFLPRLVATQLPDYPQELERLDRKTLEVWAQAYADESRQVHGTDRHLTDKRPDNVLYLGLARVLFPRAKVIITQRDARDVATSLFATRLGTAAHYATDLTHIRHYLGQIQRLITHWQTLFGDDLIIANYEQLVADPRAALSQVLTALGESWDDQCLNFHQLRNPVRTASVLQVRQPLNAESVGRWKRFESAFRDWR